MLTLGALMFLTLDVVRAENPLIFKIKRNTNKNEVIYRARAQKEKSFSKDNPIESYWLMHEEEGQKEELTGIEKSMAYGVDIKEVKDGLVKFEMSAVEDRDFQMKFMQGKPRVVSKYQGKDYVLEWIYVHASTGFILPTVDRVELHGRWVKDGKPMVEIVKD